MRELWNRTTLKIAVYVMGTFIAVSCTSDEFFGIEDYEGLSYQTLKKIAKSKEYIEFQKQIIYSMEEIRSIDTTQVFVIDYYEGRPVYSTKKQYSIRPVIDARKELVTAYPEYEIATTDECEQILKLAIINNASINSLVKNSFLYAIKRTKSVNEETDAVRWIRKKSGSEFISDTGDWTDLITGANSEWSIKGLFMWYAYDNYYNTVYDALVLTEGTHKEHGGYCWDSDGSGILIVDPNATAKKMTFNCNNLSPLPSFDFHVHPSGNTGASDDDYSAWVSMFWGDHYIFNCAGDLRYYEY